MKIPRPKHHIGDVVVNDHGTQFVINYSFYEDGVHVYVSKSLPTLKNDDQVTLIITTPEDKILYNLTRNTLDQSTDTV